MPKLALLGLAGALLSAAGCGSAVAAPIQALVWKGHTWKVTNGPMAGISPGSGGNVFVDARGYLHLKIAHKGSSWTCAELYTADRLGFGTYQWQIEGAIDAMDPTTVLGLFPYGPAAGVGRDGENEIDVEFARWNGTIRANADFTYYPATGHGKKDIGGSPIASDTDSFSFRLSGKTFTTARTVWGQRSVTSTLMLGLRPLGSTSRGLHSHTYAPADFRTRIPQVAVPLGINFWSFQVHPARDQEVIIRDFRHVPEKA